MEMNKIIGIIIGKKLGEWQRIDAEGNSIAQMESAWDAARKILARRATQGESND